ncbi:MAG TPA: hypothetical protein VFS43_46965 [Polyangiaceae bacterium]|nr:hypothetical protein [Polyangiaceae bacterium]
MYVKELRRPEDFLEAVRKYGKPVRVGERAVALPSHEQGGVVTRVALERHYVADVTDDVQGEMRLIFTERLVEREGEFPFNDSLLERLKSQEYKVIPTGRISGAA